MPSPPTLSDCSGRTVVITGANAGLGYWSTEQLAAAGAHVVLACRNADKGAAAVTAVRRQVPAARLDVVLLDLADLASVATAARQLIEIPGGIDALVCNAGLTVAGNTHRRSTRDGFELLFGTNYLGHFALAAQVFAALRPGGRVVTVGSIMHRWSPLELDDLHGQRRFRAAQQYGRSKTAMMSFAFELDRRCRAAGRAVSALAAHPGFALDSLAPNRPGVNQVRPVARAAAQLSRPVCQGKDAGARPLVHAAVAPEVRGGQYWGPGGWQGLTGTPALNRARSFARDEAIASRLWAESERLTGVSWALRA